MKRGLVLTSLVGLTLAGAAITQARFFSADAAMGARVPAVGSPSASDIERKLVRAEGRVSTYPGALVVVGTDTAGTLVRLSVDEKSKVQRGQILGEIRAEDTRAALAMSRTRMNESAADIRLFESELHRAEGLYNEKVGTKQAVDRAQRDLEEARARHESSAADVRRIEAVLSKTYIVAPISGTVLQRNAQPGESLKEQASVVTIAHLNHMRIEAEVDEFDAGRVTLGTEVIVKAEGYDNQQWRGRVEEIPDSVVARKLKPEDPGRPTDTRVLLVKIALLEKTPLKLGQRVEVEIKRQ